MLVPIATGELPCGVALMSAEEYARFYHSHFLSCHDGAVPELQLTQTMTDRRSPRKAAAKREWDRFVRSNQRVIASIGLPDSIFSSVGHFDDFLSHGHLDHHLDAGDFRVEALDSAQYDALVMLTESYFAAGYEWFTPGALQTADQHSLARRFAG